MAFHLHLHGLALRCVNGKYSQGIWRSKAEVGHLLDRLASFVGIEIHDNHLFTTNCPDHDVISLLPAHAPRLGLIFASFHDSFLVIDTFTLSLQYLGFFNMMSLHARTVESIVKVGRLLFKTFHFRCSPSSDRVWSQSFKSRILKVNAFGGSGRVKSLI